MIAKRVLESENLHIGAKSHLPNAVGVEIELVLVEGGEMLKTHSRS